MLRRFCSRPHTTASVAGAPQLYICHLRMAVGSQPPASSTRTWRRCGARMGAWSGWKPRHGQRAIAINSMEDDQLTYWDKAWSTNLGADPLLQLRQVKAMFNDAQYRKKYIKYDSSS